MAEGVLEGITGSDDAAHQTDADDEGRIETQAFAAALAADHAKYDPAVASAAADFLRNQSDLLKQQTAQVEQERPLRLQRLRSQSREGKLRRFGQRIRNGMQVATALVFALIGLGLGVMVYDAFTARSVVVDPFDTPPALLARGLSGKVVAGDLLDQDSEAIPDLVAA